MTIDVGSTVGDYQVVAVLGAGGMGKVFKVRNLTSDRIEAMKVLLPDLTAEPDLADRFLREIKALASLSHPNIANLHSAHRFENQLLMFMEFVEGITLDDKLKQGKLSVAEAVDYVGQALSALSYAHQHSVVHRDIKPANMMLTANGAIKLMDFGIAKSGADSKVSITGTTMGSLCYMSPEQIRGVQTLDPRSDLYSVGVSLYELVTGQRPFEGESQSSIMSARLEKDPKPPISVDPSLPPALNEIILTAVQREPERRFQNAEAFRKALSSVAASVIPAAASVAATVPVAPAGAPVPAAPKSRRGLWVTVGALCAVAVVVAVVQFAPFRRAGATAPAPESVAAPASPAPAPATAPVETPAPAAAAEVSPSPQPSTAPSVAAPQSTPRPVLDSRAPVRAVDSRQPSRLAATMSSAPPMSESPAPAAPPVQQQAAPAASPVQTPAAPAPDLAARRAEMQSLRESLAQLSTQAGAIRNTMQSIQRSQAAGGLGLRRDWVEAAGMMDTFIRAASDALNANDPAAAQDFMRKAEIQVNKLDKALK